MMTGKKKDTLPKLKSMHYSGKRATFLEMENQNDTKENMTFSATWQHCVLCIIYMYFRSCRLLLVRCAFFYILILLNFTWPCISRSSRTLFFFLSVRNAWFCGICKWEMIEQRKCDYWKRIGEPRFQKPDTFFRLNTIWLWVYASFGIVLRQSLIKAEI